jgi:hypothetical protein
LTSSRLAEAQRLLKATSGIRTQKDARLAVELLAETLDALAAKPAVATTARPTATAAPAAKPAAPAPGLISAAQVVNNVTDRLHRAEYSKNSASAAKPAAPTPAPRPAPVAVKPTNAAPPATSGFVTAKEFAVEPMKMQKTEWDQLTDADKSRFFREGGKLVADPKAPRR